MQRRRFAVLATTAMLTVMASPGPALAHSRVYASSGGGVIVAQRYNPDFNDGHSQLVAVDPDTGDVRVLTTGNEDTSPDISPDGMSIVFGRCAGGVDCGDSDQPVRNTIWMMRADGSGQHQIAGCEPPNCEGVADPSFSPDGRRVTFAKDYIDPDGTHQHGVFIMLTDGTDQRLVTSHPDGSPPEGFSAGQPHFSPDGRSIVFQRGEVACAVELMVVNTDGTGLRPLLPDALTNPNDPHSVNAADPSWAPNSPRIAFTQINCPPPPPAAGDFFVNVATVHPDGSGLKVLTVSDPDNFWYTPDYSPNGSRLVFVHGTGPNGAHLVITNTAGRHVRELPSATSDAYFQPSWGVTPRSNHPR